MTPGEELDDLLGWVRAWFDGAIGLREEQQRMAMAVGARDLLPPDAALRTPFGQRMLQIHKALTELKALRAAEVKP